MNVIANLVTPDTTVRPLVHGTRMALIANTPVDVETGLTAVNRTAFACAKEDFTGLYV
jgi:hypothetical protein